MTTTATLLSLFSTVFCIIQTLEYLSLKRTLSDNGALSWGVIRAAKKSWLDRIFSGKLFNRILYLQLLLCILVGTQALPMGARSFACGFILVIYLLTLVRFGGSANGGSDSMGMLLLLTTFLIALGESITKPEVVKFGIYYLGIQALASYMIAGFVKLRRDEWRNGQALRFFMNSSPIASTRSKQLSPQSAKWIAWVVIAFEIAFPILASHHLLVIPTFFVGALFHLFIAWSFGLNRFLIAWLGSYPAIYFLLHG